MMQNLVGPVDAVLFDVDGVLLDSLPVHLRFCREKSAQYGLDLIIPDPPDFKRMVRAGVVVSPMKNFFLAVGFPELAAARADEEYRAEFAMRYRPHLFAEAAEMLASLAAEGLVLGIATSNTLANVRAGLGDAIRHFDSRYLFARDDKNGVTKGDALREASRRLQNPPSCLVYVGDQPQDYDAARQAGAQFVAVTYGWGIEEGDFEVPEARKPVEILNFIIPVRRQRGTLDLATRDSRNGGCHFEG